MSAIPLDQTIGAGSLISVRVSFTSILPLSRPAETDIVSALQDTGNFSAASFTYDVTSGTGISNSGTIYGQVTADDDGGDISNQIKNYLNTFKTVVGITVGEIDTANSTPSGQTFFDQIAAFFSKGLTSTSNFILIVLVILVVAIYFISKSKNIRIGI